jgi:hypothetical protein
LKILHASNYQILIQIKCYIFVTWTEYSEMLNYKPLTSNVVLRKASVTLKKTREKMKKIRKIEI